MSPPSLGILVACDKFKGSLDAVAVCEAIARGLSRSMPAARIAIHPITDGGEGFAESLRGPLNGRWVKVPAHDALGRAIEARYVIGDADGTRVAVVEMAEASGLWRVQAADREILRSSTYGTGELMRHAVVESRAGRLIVGLGGSATNDGGAGMAAALGIRFLDSGGGVVEPFPAAMAGRLERVDWSGLIPLPPVAAACDVGHPLLGPGGATRIFGPQKGAVESDLPVLEEALERMVRAADAERAANSPGAGAAGGLGFGLTAFAGAELVPGFDLVAGLTGLDRKLREVDLVVTGEGSLDSQSLGGKGPVSLARLAKRMGKTVIACCGRADDLVGHAGVFDEILELRSSGLPTETLMAEAQSLLTGLAERFGNRLASVNSRNAP